MAIPFLQHLDLKSSAELRNALLHKTTEGAASNTEAGIIYDTGSDTVKYYNGSAWISLTANTDNYVDGASLSGTDLILTRTGSLADLTVDLSSLDELVNDSTITITAGDALSTTVAGNTFTTNQAANGEITINHDSVSRTDTATTSAPAYGGTFEAVTSVTTNAQGHVTAIDVSTVTIPASDDTTYDLETAPTGTAIRLKGSDSTNDDVTISGTANEVEVSRTSASELTVGLPDNVTIANDLTVNNDVTISGNLEVTGTVTTVNETVRVIENNTIEFEGATADDFEIKLTGGDPTADHTVSLPDASGTIALTSDIQGGYAETITDSVSGTTFNHGLGEDVIVQLFDTDTKETVYADVVRDGNYLDITFASTPANSIRVLVQKIG